MTVKLLTETSLEVSKPKRRMYRATGSSESTLVKMPHCWKLHVMVQLLYIHTYTVFIDFSLTVKAATLIFIYGRGLAISSAKEGKFLIW